MSRNYILSDVLCSITNIRSSCFKKTINVPYSKVSMNVLGVLHRYGYIGEFKEFDVRENVKNIRVKVKFDDNSANMLSKVSHMSKPSRRMYAGLSSIEFLINKNRGGLVIVSTSKGIMSANDAVKNQVGGEVLCVVY